jgi:hypothetical protein
MFNKILFKNRYRYWQHNFKRRNFSQLNDKDIDYFRTIMNGTQVVTDLDVIEPHNLCFRKLDKGASKLLLLPKTT